MRIIKRQTLVKYWNKHVALEIPLKALHAEIIDANWKNPSELIMQYPSASIINQKRVVFNIKGNRFRLVVDIEYKIGIVFIVWCGTHAEYDKLKIEELKYDNKN